MAPVLTLFCPPVSTSADTGTQAGDDEVGAAAA
jgi:hypothetical protein